MQAEEPQETPSASQPCSALLRNKIHKANKQNPEPPHHRPEVLLCPSFWCRSDPIPAAQEELCWSTKRSAAPCQRGDGERRAELTAPSTRPTAAFILLHFTFLSFFSFFFLIEEMGLSQAVPSNAAGTVTRHSPARTSRAQLTAPEHSAQPQHLLSAQLPPDLLAPKRVSPQRSDPRQRSLQPAGFTSEQNFAKRFQSGAASQRAARPRTASAGPGRSLPSPGCSAGPSPGAFRLRSPHRSVPSSWLSRRRWKSKRTAQRGAGDCRRSLLVGLGALLDPLPNLQP